MFDSKLDPAHPFAQIQKMFDKEWFLLIAGDAEHFNGMTISWGMTGTMWGKPCVMIMIRPQRYTSSFLKKTGEFTLNAFDEKCRKGLMMCGSLSGRTMPNKLIESGFTPCAFEGVHTPAIAESNFVVGCKILYSLPFNPSTMPIAITEKWYPQGDFHTLYFAEVVSMESRT